ncbi:hypothetical protein TcWFU_004874 [Taenia crassiceps]|uniref:Uncharacterized protein n=1 Tax=Taenia crassiceps TaxID=6207 RepID=A0ABR4QB62_9CEST
MSIYNLILLFTLLCFFLAAQARPHHNHSGVHTKSIHPKLAVKSASRRSVIWSGAASYPGYRDSRKRKHDKEHSKALSKTYAKYAVESAQKPMESINFQLHNKERANDKRYREGLQELADLM